MAELYLVRHGQASFGAENYDQLSSLGMEQAELLGEHFAARGVIFDQLITGTQERHRQTAESLCRGMEHTPQQLSHPGLNEYDFDRLITAYIAQHPPVRPREESDSHTFYSHLKKTLLLWCQDLLEGELPETWQEFLQRINSALETIQQSGARRILAVSSGGPISTIAHLALQAPATTAMNDVA